MTYNELIDTFNKILDKLELLRKSLTDSTIAMRNEIKNLKEKIDNEIKDLKESLTDINDTMQMLHSSTIAMRNEIKNLKEKIEEQNRIQGELLLSDVALQLFYIYMDLYSSAWIELHRVDLGYLIVVDDYDSILLIIVTNLASDNTEKLLKNIGDVLEKTLDKKIIYKVFAPTQLIDSKIGI